MFNKTRGDAIIFRAQGCKKVQQFYTTNVAFIEHIKLQKSIYFGETVCI